jgi:hypothetical protein
MGSVLGTVFHFMSVLMAFFVQLPSAFEILEEQRASAKKQSEISAMKRITLVPLQTHHISIAIAITLYIMNHIQHETTCEARSR